MIATYIMIGSCMKIGDWEEMDGGEMVLITMGMTMIRERLVYSCLFVCVCVYIYVSV
jgi:hypothetical protein